MTPFEAALAAYHAGDEEACFIIHRDDGLEEAVPLHGFFEAHEFLRLDERALELCRGEVLDVGAAAGRHSLALQRRGLEVWSLDILPEAVRILAARGARRPILADIFQWQERPFDTVLMLMNGIGLVGTPERLDEFLAHARKLVKPGGQILCDSYDVRVTKDPDHVTYRERNQELGRAMGQQWLQIEFEKQKTAPFPWLHLDFESLTRHGAQAGWGCEQLGAELDGRYLARLTPNKT